MQIKRARLNKKLSDITRIKRILSIRRKRFLFIFIIILIYIILQLYYYFFILCEVSYRFLWILLIILFISPILIHKIISYLEYDENKKISKMEFVLNTHYKQIETLIRIENENLIELEEDLADDLYRLIENLVQSKKENSKETILFKEIYKELVALYSKYKEKENPVMNEKILCDDIYKIIAKEGYGLFIQNNPIFISILNKLKILYKQYEEKQKLYDEIGKIESAKEELKSEFDESKNE